MKKLIAFLLGVFVIVVLASAMLDRGQVSAEGKSDFVKGEILVKFRDTIGPSEVNEVHKN